MEGKIIKIISNQYTVLINNQEVVCTSRGLFRKQDIIPLVGDKVLVDLEDKVITNVLPRNNQLIRPAVANVDIGLIIMSVKEPKLSLDLLDKLIVNMTINKIEPVICFTKLDLIKDKNKFTELVNYYQSIGIKI